MRELGISYGASCHAKIWTNDTISFVSLIDRLMDPVRTPETVEEYRKLKGDAKQKAKDKGGFVGGILKDGKRNGANVLSRSMLTLDADKATKAFLDDFKASFPYSAILYSTHSHTLESPRVRVIVPLSRDITAEEYAAVSRYVAADIGLEMFDQCSFRPAQLMYWPSVPKDGEYVFMEISDKPWLNPDDILSKHPDWRNMETLPSLPSENTARNPSGRKPEDPREKNGIVGAFCRAYTVDDAISEFLSDVYEPAGSGRYSYREADSKAGLVVYDGLWAYSNHATDPAAVGHLLNAFDLVRIHRFGSLDTSADPGTPVNRLPSYQAMIEFASKDAATVHEEMEAKRQSAISDFSGSPDNDEWLTRLARDKSGKILTTVNNYRLILLHDRGFQGIRRNIFTNEIVISSPVPWKRLYAESSSWTDTDFANLVAYIEDHYAFPTPNERLRQALDIVSSERSFHPVREYLESLPVWDGKPRIDTLFIANLGAPDTLYVRTVTGMMFIAAVKRVYEPGCKFDTMLVLCGKQGQKKSTFIQRFCRPEWYASRISLTETRDKTAAEKLQGRWIVEFDEMSGMAKTEIETLKSFVSTQDDQYRPAYGRTSVHHKRQCVFFGTSNAKDGFLRDPTGNRRFWPVMTDKAYEGDPWTDFDDDYVGQFWAEALHRYRAGEKIYITDPEILASATTEQNAAMEWDDREGIVERFLNTPVPENWYSLSEDERKRYFQSRDDFGAPLSKPDSGKTILRNRVCNMEIWTECFGKNRSDITPRDSMAIKTIMRKIKGWEFLERKKDFNVYGTVFGYVRTDEETEENIPF